MVAVGARKLCVVYVLVGEVSAGVVAGEGDKVAFEIVTKQTGVAAERVDVFGSGLVVDPVAVVVGEFGEYELVFVNHIAIEVQMSGAAVIAESWQDVCSTRTHNVGQRVAHLCLRQGRFLCVIDAAFVDAVPGNLAVGVHIVFVNGVAAEHHTCTIDHAVAAFPFDGGDVVGNAHSLFNQRRQRVVEGAAGIVHKIDHSDAVLVAIVEGDGTAVAEPERVAGSDNPFDIVGSEVHTVQLVFDEDAVLGVFDANPSLGSTHLDGIHKVEENIYKFAVNSSIEARLGNIGATATFLPATRIMVIIGISTDDGIGIPIVIVFVAGDEIVIIAGHYNGFHLFPFAGEPVVCWQLQTVAFGLCSLFGSGSNGIVGFELLF